MPSTVATVRLGVARNELLLRKVEEFSSSLPVSGLGTSSGTEGPAGTASTLVFDSVDSTLSSPVDSPQHGLVSLELDDFGGVVLNWGEAHVSLSLLLSHGGEHTVAESVVVLGVVPVGDVVILGLEDLESELVLFSGSVGETLSLHMGSELLVKLGLSLRLLEHVLGVDSSLPEQLMSDIAPDATIIPRIKTVFFIRFDFS